jgi:hypothetical protein
MVKLVPKTSTDGSMSQNKSIVQSEVNKRRLEMNKDVFKKSQRDRDDLKLAKATFKHNPSAKVKEDILGSLDRYDIKDFVRLIRFYDNTFFRMVRDLTPGRDVTDSGIIIKPHILEHNIVKDFSLS